MRKWAPLLLVLASLVACSSSPDTHTLKGTMTLVGYSNIYTRSDTREAGDECTGHEGYDDIAAGVQVKVSDGSKTLGVGELGLGTLRVDSDSSETCVFPIRVDDVSDSKFYTVEVSHRGGISYSAAKLDRSGWRVYFSL